MSGKFIPNSDDGFRRVAGRLAKAVARDPVRYTLSVEDSQRLTAAVDFFEAEVVRLKAPGLKNTIAVNRKRKARQAAEVEVRRCANVIRASDRVSAVDKFEAGISERPKKLGERKVPAEPPVLRFKGSGCEGSIDGSYHILHYYDGPQLRLHQKPHGATRIELFVDLVRQGQPIPKFPGQYLDGRPWYLRSFTKSPIKVHHPVPAEAMMVVYWARWADARGNVGPYSQTCVARVEGGFALGSLSKLGPMPTIEQLKNDPKYLLTLWSLHERLLRDGSIQRLLEHSAGASDASNEIELRRPKKLDDDDEPRSDAA